MSEREGNPVKLNRICDGRKATSTNTIKANYKSLSFSYSKHLNQNNFKRGKEVQTTFWRSALAGNLQSLPQINPRQGAAKEEAERMTELQEERETCANIFYDNFILPSRPNF